MTNSPKIQFRKRIRSQMHLGAVILVVIVIAVSVGALLTVAKFRKLTKSIRDRAHEIPNSARLSNEIGNLRVAFAQISHEPAIQSRITRLMPGDDSVGAEFWPLHFQLQLQEVYSALQDYELLLDAAGQNESELLDNSLELSSARKIHRDLDWIYNNFYGKDYSDEVFRTLLGDKLEEIQQEVNLLPTHMEERMAAFARSARADYYSWFLNVILLAIAGVAAVLWLMRRFHKKVFQPIDHLVCDTRRVASGDFDHRIKITSDDEIAELASAMNLMTSRFQDINLDLNNQVEQRTREVVRTDQMASVGFLAAGVAHEINNPLASIAWSAESLESRLHDILTPENGVSESDCEEILEMKKYLKRIQDEAFRCKGITSSLLNFARLGDAQKTTTELGPLIEDVVEMVRPLSRYRDKQIVVQCDPTVLAVVNAQEMKQVVLNLITNALDSVDEGGTVKAELKQDQDQVLFVVTDNGCGMEADVLQNIFEPFFTRRRDGQGTGLGLSITYRIIQEHGGSIRPHSDGAGAGSTFTVSLPVVSNDKEQRKAA